MLTLLLASPAALAQTAIPQPTPQPAPLLSGKAPALLPSVQLRPGELGTLGQARVALLSVNDSRCPEGVACIWAGEVQARVLLIEKGRWRLLRLKWPAPGTSSHEQIPGQSADPSLHITAVSGWGDELRLTLSR
ncbi:hypothetical protein GCM10017783_04210 [Deinococcus piscis]|uniref:Uncharacterized protein n=2 Tax=Deinococcus piscis TaxID=394230 RepID=A0ABQ3JYE4_9DEIO|nr:hypothetical protein GCM10017783_04210 [Deinococcus piscis]